VLIGPVKNSNYLVKTNFCEMDNTQESNRLQDLYLKGVRPNGKDIGVGAYGRESDCQF